MARRDATQHHAQGMADDPMAEPDDSAEHQLPPPVSVDLDQTIRSYWLDRARQHTSDTYAGVPLAKFPEDLRVYEHLLWTSRTRIVIELGAHLGGSALWFRDRLQTMARYGRIRDGHMITVDIETAAAREFLARADPGYAETITVIEAHVQDPALPERIAELLPPDAMTMLVEDSAHTFETTAAALAGFARFVPLGGYFVVEDGCVDIEEMRLSEDRPRGVLPALEAWLETDEGREFTVRRDLERYGLSCHPHGFLQRVATH
jgi:cephalosporin hydroxylase